MQIKYGIIQQLDVLWTSNRNRRRSKYKENSEILDKVNNKGESVLNTCHEIEEIKIKLLKYTFAVFFIDLLTNKLSCGGFNVFFYETKNLYNSLILEALDAIKANEIFNIFNQIVEFVKKDDLHMKKFIESPSISEDASGMSNKINEFYKSNFENKISIAEIISTLNDYKYFYIKFYNEEISKELL